MSVDPSTARGLPSSCLHCRKHRRSGLDRHYLPVDANPHADSSSAYTCSRLRTLLGTPRPKAHILALEAFPAMAAVLAVPTGHQRQAGRPVAPRPEPIRQGAQVPQLSAAAKAQTCRSNSAADTRSSMAMMLAWPSATPYAARAASSRGRSSSLDRGSRRAGRRPARPQTPVVPQTPAQIVDDCRMGVPSSTS